MRFVHSFCVNSTSTPGRATLLIGRYSPLNGASGFTRFDGAHDQVAKRLQAGGFYTGMIGQLHFSRDPTGFGRWIVLPGRPAYFVP